MPAETHREYQAHGQRLDQGQGDIDQGLLYSSLNSPRLQLRRGDEEGVINLVTPKTGTVDWLQSKVMAMGADKIVGHLGGKNISTFDALTLHEVGHAVDEAKGFMADKVGNVTYGRLVGSFDRGGGCRRRRRQGLLQGLRHPAARLSRRLPEGGAGEEEAGRRERRHRRAQARRQVRLEGARQASGGRLRREHPPEELRLRPARDVATAAPPSTRLAARSTRRPTRASG